MNISGIRPFDGFYDYNKIAINELSNTKAPDQVKPAEQPAKESVKISQAEIDAARANQTFGAYDYANQYNPNATYDLKGATSDLKTLDVEKAISDMQKDQAIHQYQYFVGDNTSDAVAVRGTENFTL